MHITGEWYSNGGWKRLVRFLLGKQQTLPWSLRGKFLPWELWKASWFLWNRAPLSTTPGLLELTCCCNNGHQSIQFSSVARSCLTLCDPIYHNMPGFPVQHQLPELAQTHVHWVSDAIQPSHPLSSPSPPVLSLAQHQGIFQGVSSLHQVPKVLEFQLPDQLFQWIFRTDLL